MSISAIITIVITVAILSVVTFVIYWRYRTILRRAKGIERGLKMVPLLIHLPPSSDDTEVGSRDIRDVVEEKLSQAETLYNVIASTAKKGFKSKFYGQRHLSFEIVAHKGLVQFYVAVPIVLEEVVKQAVLSAYPTAQLEEIEEYNIFNPESKIGGTAGGELTLKKEYPYPISTFRDSKQDVMQSLLNALSSLEEDDGAAVQILVRPAKEDWEKEAHSLVSSKRKDKGKSSGGIKDILSPKEMVQALWKPPEAKETKPEDKQLTSLEQSTLDAIEHKTRSAGYETLIRVVASSQDSQRAKAIMHNIVATFSLFNAQGMNGFSFSEAKDLEEFVTAFIFRFFPPEIDENILNSVELATIFHLPDSSFSPTSRLKRQASKQVDGPHNAPKEGFLLGYNVFRGIKKEIRLTEEDRRRHMYIIGQTGTGKSSFLENLALQDMLKGGGFAFIDPHGDAVESLISMIPAERTEDIIYFNPGDMDFPMGLNLFEQKNPEQKDFLIQEAIQMLYRLYDPQHQGIIGPRYEHMFRNAALLLMADPEGSTFVDIPKLFRDDQFVRQKLKHVTDKSVIDFWTKEIPQSRRSNDFGEVTSWFVSKFGAFLSNQTMRNIIGQNKSSFDLRDIMDNKKILLVNLSKGRLGELNSMLLGMIFVMKFQAAAMSRADVPQDQRPDFSLYVDEFQNFSTDSFATILSEARKYHLNLIVANQFIGQLTEEIRDAVFGNVGTIISLRAGATDADFLVKQFSPTFDAQDIVKLPNFHAITSLMIDGVPSQPFSMSTIPPLGNPNEQLGIALKQLSASKYGRPKAAVEKEIFDRLETKPAPSPFGNNPRGASPAPSKKPVGSPASSSSFLDEWLAKRKAQQKSPAGTQSKAVATKGVGTGSAKSDAQRTEGSKGPQEPNAQPVSVPQSTSPNVEQKTPNQSVAPQPVTEPSTEKTSSNENPPPQSQPKPPKSNSQESMKIPRDDDSNSSNSTDNLDSGEIYIDKEGNLFSS